MLRNRGSDATKIFVSFLNEVLSLNAQESAVITVGDTYVHPQ